MPKTTTTSGVTPLPSGRSHMGPLTSFAVNPDGVRFETQEAKETVVLFLRQHFIVNVSWILLAVVMIIAPTVLFPVLFHFVSLPFSIPLNLVIIATAWWYVATFGFVLAKFLGWFINIYIVTDERIVDIDFYYLLYKHLSEAELNRIQDISYTTGGILATIFNDGNVNIQTAGEVPTLTFDKVPHPEKVVETIRKLVEKHAHSL